MIPGLRCEWSLKNPERIAKIGPEEYQYGIDITKIPNGPSECQAPSWQCVTIKCDFGKLETQE